MQIEQAINSQFAIRRRQEIYERHKSCKLVFHYSWYIFAVGPRRADGSATSQESEVQGSIPDPATYFRSPSAESRAVVSHWRKNAHSELVNR